MHWSSNIFKRILIIKTHIPSNKKQKNPYNHYLFFVEKQRIQSKNIWESLVKKMYFVQLWPNTLVKYIIFIHTTFLIWTGESDYILIKGWNIVQWFNDQPLKLSIMNNSILVLVWILEYTYFQGLRFDSYQCQFRWASLNFSKKWIIVHYGTILYFSRLISLPAKSIIICINRGLNSIFLNLFTFKVCDFRHKVIWP